VTYPGNSFTSKAEPPKPEKPKVEKVVSGEVQRRKTPLGKKFKEVFIGGDAKSVGSYVMWEIVVPMVKDTITDIVSQGVEQMMYGTSRSAARRTAASRAGHVAYTAYNRVTQAAASRPEPKVDITRQARASHNFDGIIIPSRAEAEQVIDGLVNLIGTYEQASVADLYDLVGITGEYTDDRWGWQDIQGMGVTPSRSGYLLDLPQPVELKKA
jgi:hypothetical protein